MSLFRDLGKEFGLEELGEELEEFSLTDLELEMLGHQSFINDAWVSDELSSDEKELADELLHHLEQYGERYTFSEDGSRVIIKESVTIGREADLLVPASDYTVGRVHCELVKHSLGRWAIRDLGSAHGTFLTRRWQESRLNQDEFRLETGDIVRIGNQLKFKVL